VARVRAVRSSARDRYVDELQALLDAGAQLYRHHDPKASAAAFSLAAAEYPESVDAHLRAGLVQAELGRTDAARRSLERVLELEPGNTTARERLGALTGR
jgi:Tfp pilus assembly protein PilF